MIKLSISYTQWWVPENDRRREEGTVSPKYCSAPLFALPTFLVIIISTFYSVKILHLSKFKISIMTNQKSVFFLLRVKIVDIIMADTKIYR